MSLNVGTSHQGDNELQNPTNGNDSAKKTEEVQKPTAYLHILHNCDHSCYKMNKVYRHGSPRAGPGGGLAGQANNCQAPCIKAHSNM